MKTLSELDRSFDAVVVGLGPVGALAANLLGRQGLAVLALDAAAAQYDLPRAIAIDDVALRLLQPLAIADHIADSLAVYRATEYCNADGLLLRRIVQPPPPHPLAWPPYVSFIQPQLETALRHALDACPRIQTGLGLRAQIESFSSGGAVLRVTDPRTAASRDVSCSYVLACDGASSGVRRQLKMELEDLAFDERWLVVDVLVDDAAPLPEINIQYCDPARPCTYVRGPGALRRWEFMLLPGEDPEAMARHDTVWRLLGAFLQPERGRIWRAATYRFHALIAREWRRGNVFLLGDAAHQTPPFMGQGLNQGLRDADNLCWKIGTVFQQRALPAMLDTYAIERRPTTRAVIEVAKQLGTVICELDRAAAARRDERMLDEMRQGLGTIVRQNLIPNSLGTGFIMRGSDGVPAPGAGHMFPQPWVQTPAGRQRLDDLVPAGFLLIARSGWAPDPGDRQSAERLRVHLATLGAAGPPVEPIREVDGLIARWMSSIGADAALIRPDHFVFGTACGRDPERQLLHRLIAACAGHAA